MVNGIFLSHPKYATNLLTCFHMSDCNPSPTPFQFGVKLTMECTTPLVDATLYHQFVTSLLYLKHNMLDIYFVINMVFRFMQKPHETRWQETKRILRYLKGTMSYGVFYLSSATILLLGYTDSDWVGDSLDRRFSAPYLFQCGLGPISWSSKKVKTLALSSCEAEYKATKEEAEEAILLRHFLTDLRLIQKYAIELRCDNQGEIQLAYNKICHSEIRHIDIDAHYI
jgi:hypothetical protein